MNKTSLSLAVLSLLSVPILSFPAETVSAEAAALEPTSPHTVTYNIGLYSQYVFRGLTQTDNKPAVQGGVDYAHASGFYVGSWTSNLSSLEDGGNYEGSSLEIDVYGGYRRTIGDTGISYDVGLLNYIYPGHKSAAGKANAGFTDPYTLEAYAALSYEWLQAKVSYGITDIFGVKNSDGAYYAELNANIPVAETGITANLHYGYQDYKGSVGGVNNNKLYTYNDWKVGATKSWRNGVNLGVFYTGTDAKDAGYTLLGDNIGQDTLTAFVQKTF